MNPRIHESSDASHSTLYRTLSLPRCRVMSVRRAVSHRPTCLKCCKARAGECLFFSASLPFQVRLLLIRGNTWGKKAEQCYQTAPLGIVRHLTNSRRMACVPGKHATTQKSRPDPSFKSSQNPRRCAPLVGRQLPCCHHCRTVAEVGRLARTPTPAGAAVEGRLPTGARVAHPSPPDGLTATGFFFAALVPLLLAEALLLLPPPPPPPPFDCSCADLSRFSRSNPCRRLPSAPAAPPEPAPPAPAMLCRQEGASAAAASPSRRVLPGSATDSPRNTHLKGGGSG